MIRFNRELRVISTPPPQMISADDAERQVIKARHDAYRRALERVGATPGTVRNLITEDAHCLILGEERA